MRCVPARAVCAGRRRTAKLSKVAMQPRFVQMVGQPAAEEALDLRAMDFDVVTMVGAIVMVTPPTTTAAKKVCCTIMAVTMIEPGAMATLTADGGTLASPSIMAAISSRRAGV